MSVACAPFDTTYGKSLPVAAHALQASAEPQPFDLWTVTSRTSESESRVRLALALRRADDSERSEARSQAVQPWLPGPPESESSVSIVSVTWSPMKSLASCLQLYIDSESYPYRRLRLHWWRPCGVTWDAVTETVVVLKPRQTSLIPRQTSP